MTRQTVEQWAPVGRPDLRSFVPQERRVAPLLLWLACLAAAVALLLWLGDGRLVAPDLTAPSTWGDWAADRGTAEAVVAVLRIVALGLAWYLVGVTAVSVLAHAAQAARLVRVADALSFGPVRAVVRQALGVGLAVGVVASALPPGALGSKGPTATASVAAIADDDLGVGPSPSARPHAVASSTVGDGDAAGAAGGSTGAVPPAAAARSASGTGPPVPAPDDVAARDVARSFDTAGPTSAPGTAAATPTPPGAPATLTATPLDPASPAAVAGDVTVDGVGPGDGKDRVVADDRAPARSGGDGATGPAGSAVDPDEDRAGTGPVVTDDGSREVRVEPGDHLWGLAEEQLRDALGRQPTEREILLHWERVVERNTDRLVVPSNPDLLRPGQLILLPAVEVGG